MEFQNPKMENAYRIAGLLSNFIQNKISPEEMKELDEWKNASDHNQRLFDELTDKEKLSKALPLWVEIEHKLILPNKN